MVVRFAASGDNMALLVPRAIIDELGVIEGTEAELAVQDGKLVVTPGMTPHYDLSELLSGINEENRHGEAHTGLAVGSEFA